MKTAKTKMDKYDLARVSTVIALSLALIVILIIPKDIIDQPNIIGRVLASVRIVSGLPPTFDQNLVNYSIIQSNTYFFDVNCTDPEPLDDVYYYDNFSGFEINDTTGIINQSGFSQDVVGNNSIKITCSDGIQNTSQTFILQINESNNAPVLSSIGSQIATEGDEFFLDVDATDPENDVLIFSENISFFAINSSSGVINFTPILSQVGNHTINISVFDGLLYDWEIVSLTITRGPFCGDDSCGNGESCLSCSSDCGECPAIPQSSSQVSSGTVSATGPQVQIGPSQIPFYKCEEKWECSQWDSCSLEGFRSRKCKDINRCSTKGKKPREVEECEYQPTCFDGLQNGDEDGIDCGGPCRSCLVANCFDEIQNANEQGIDCGGPCRSCEEENLQKQQQPFVEIPGVIKIPRKFPWILIIIMSILVVLTVAIDQLYIRIIRKRKFDEFKEALTKYRPFRRKVYKIVIDAPIITWIISLHIFYFSTDLEQMVWFVWIPLVLIITLPFLISWLYVHYTYYEYKKKRKEEILRLTHKREIRQLIGVENKVLMDVEGKVKNSVLEAAQQHKFENARELYKELNPLYGLLSSIVKKRKNRLDVSRIQADVFQLMLDIADSKILLKFGKEYPEFMAIHEKVVHIIDRINFDTSDIEGELMDEIRNISTPYMLLVIKEREYFVPIYNSLVDIYNYLLEKNSQVESEDEEIAKIERSFTDGIKNISKQSKLIETIQNNSNFADIYNSMMDLFNHYTRKQELASKIKGL